MSRMHEYRELDLAHSANVLEAAMNAFWKVVAESFPTAQGGDLSPEASSEFDSAAREAVMEWVVNNVPSRVTLGDVIGAIVDIMTGYDGAHEVMHWGVEPEPTEAVRRAITLRGWTAQEVLAEVERGAVKADWLRDLLEPIARDDIMWVEKRAGVRR